MTFILEDYPCGERLIVEGNQLRVARSPHKVTLPLEYSPDLAYLTGYHLGDGYLENPTLKFNRVNTSSFELLYADEYKAQITQIILPIIKDNFGVDLHIHKRKYNLWIGRINCKVVHLFFHQILKVPIGKKGYFHVPEWILQKKEFLKEFISGFFDAEGSIFVDKRNKAGITLTNSNYQFLFTMRTLLTNNFGIEFGQIYAKNKQDVFEMKTQAKEIILRFCDEIGFRHPHKIEKMQECIKQLEKIHSRKHIT
jgi:DNA-binding transcriptional regulator WhiA